MELKMPAQQPPNPSALLGEVDAISGQLISGWLRLSAGKSRQVEIMAVSDLAGVVSQCSQRLIAASPLPFQLTLPAAINDGRPHRLTVLADGFPLAGCPFWLAGEGGQRQNEVAYFRGPLQVRDGFIHGTLVVPPRPHLTVPLTVRILVDGGTAGVALADAPPTASPCQHDQQQTHRFSAPLPAQALDGFPHAITARCPLAGAGKKGVESAPLTYAHGDLFGEIHLEGGRITGQIASRATWDTPPVVDLLDENGVMLTRLRAVQAPLDAEIRKAGGVCAARFDFAPPESLPHKIHCLAGHYELAGSPLTSKDFLDIRGNIDAISEEGISGWALNRKRPAATIQLALHVDGRQRQLFRPTAHNLSVLEKLNLTRETAGYYAFRIPSPPELFDGEEHLVEVVATETGERLAGGQVVRFHTPRTLSPHGASGLTAPPRKPWPHSPPPAALRPLVSVIVLNRNGAPLLENLFISWRQHNSHPHYEFIIIDHDSNDASRAVIERWAACMPVRIVPLSYNDSFSASCNHGASVALGEHLLFLNNDIVWLQDALPQLLASLDDESVAAAGLKLLFVENDGRNGGGLGHAPQVQHMGIAYGLHGNRYWPFEIRPGDGAPTQSYAAEQVPATTGAVLLCRKHEFQRVGGFNEEYFYGFEDVEFCSRLAGALGKKIVCRNDLVALHHHGYTRLTGREKSVSARLGQNEGVLQRHLGLHLKRAFLQGLFGGEAMGGEATTVAFAVGPTQEREPFASATRAAQEAASQWRRDGLPIRALFLEAGQDWDQVAQAHVLVAMHPWYDLRLMREARADLLRLAWLDESLLDQWEANPCFAEFDLFIAAGPVAHALLTERFGPDRVVACRFPQAAVPEAPPLVNVDLLVVADLDAVREETRQSLAGLPLDKTIAILGAGWESFAPALAFWQGDPQPQRLERLIGASRLVVYSQDLPALTGKRIRALGGVTGCPAVELDSLGPIDLTSLLDGHSPLPAGTTPSASSLIDQNNCLPGHDLFATMAAISTRLARVAIRTGVRGDQLPFLATRHLAANALLDQFRHAGCVAWLEGLDDEPASRRVADVIVTLCDSPPPPAEDGAMNIAVVIEEHAPLSDQEGYSHILAGPPMPRHHADNQPTWGKDPSEPRRLVVHLDLPFKPASFLSGVEDDRKAFFISSDLLHHRGVPYPVARFIEECRRAESLAFRIPEHPEARNSLLPAMVKSLRAVERKKTTMQSHAGKPIPARARPSANGLDIAWLVSEIKSHLAAHEKYPVSAS
ncbi:MAG: glycosyltransferase family 2 protein [Thermodesulfobacteriota bacterium]